jgi:hypothetical protein
LRKVIGTEVEVKVSLLAPKVVQGMEQPFW